MSDAIKIGATISKVFQVSQEQYRDVSYTKVFTEAASIKEIIDWAKTVDKNATFHSIKFSEVL